MKYSVLLLSLFFLFSCGNESVDHVRLSGTITNTSQNHILVQSGEEVKKINLESDGSFVDTLRAERGYYLLMVDRDQLNLFLKNGYDMNITAKAGDLLNSVSFSGNGAESNNYIVQKTKFMRNGIGQPGDYFRLEKDEFEVRVAGLKKTLDTMLTNRKHLDSLLVAKEDSIHQQYIHFLESNYENVHAGFGE